MGQSIVERACGINLNILSPPMTLLNRASNLLLAGLLVAACRSPAADRALTPAHSAAIADSVRAFAATVAQGITRNGPGAWRGFFADTPAFFMAAEGQLVFPNSESATVAIQSLTRMISHIELRWGDSLRVDPLAPGLALLATAYYEARLDSAGHRLEEHGFFTGIAEHRARGWQFRDAHWSVVTPPAAAP